MTSRAATITTITTAITDGKCSISKVSKGEAGLMAVTISPASPLHMLCYPYAISTKQ
jgi:hypothetical protein